MSFSKLSLLQKIYQSFLDAIFPRRCLICSAFEGSQRTGDEVVFDALAPVTAPCFCASCRKDLRPIASPFCSKCGRPFISREGDNHVCWECLIEQRHFRRSRAFGLYDGALMEAIHRLKYGRHTSLSRPLSALLRETFFQCWDVTTVDLLVPVPLHLKRLRQRGFNQALLLIRRWAKQDGIPFDGLTLSRSRWTTRSGTGKGDCPSPILKMRRPWLRSRVLSSLTASVADGFKLQTRGSRLASAGLLSAKGLSSVGPRVRYGGREGRMIRARRPKGTAGSFLFISDFSSRALSLRVKRTS